MKIHPTFKKLLLALPFIFTILWALESVIPRHPCGPRKLCGEIDYAAIEAIKKDKFYGLNSIDKDEWEHDIKDSEKIEKKACRLYVRLYQNSSDHEVATDQAKSEIERLGEVKRVEKMDQEVLLVTLRNGVKFPIGPKLISSTIWHELNEKVDSILDSEILKNTTNFDLAISNAMTEILNIPEVSSAVLSPENKLSGQKEIFVTYKREISIDKNPVRFYRFRNDGKEHAKLRAKIDQIMREEAHLFPSNRASAEKAILGQISQLSGVRSAEPAPTSEGELKILVIYHSHILNTQEPELLRVPYGKNLK
jgi:hypothetical protein